jgi:hypothetical protein
MNGLIETLTAEHERLTRELHGVHRALVALKANSGPHRRRKMSAEARKNISVAQKKRWAKRKNGG